MFHNTSIVLLFNYNSWFLEPTLNKLIFKKNKKISWVILHGFTLEQYIWYEWTNSLVTHWLSLMRSFDRLWRKIELISKDFPSPMHFFWETPESVFWDLHNSDKYINVYTLRPSWVLCRYRNNYTDNNFYIIDKLCTYL